MAKYANGKSYRPGNDNLNEQQFTAGTEGHTGTSKTKLTRPKTHTLRVSTKRKGEKGGHWVKKRKKHG